jgi:hypothetical protein
LKNFEPIYFLLIIFFITIDFVNHTKKQIKTVKNVSKFFLSDLQ